MFILVIYKMGVNVLKNKLFFYKIDYSIKFNFFKYIYTFEKQYRNNIETI